MKSMNQNHPPIAINLLSQDNSEEYIDMELGSYYSFHRCSSREFEFQMSTASSQRDVTTSPADELFYKGKLLPLHLPLRMEMVERILSNSCSTYEEFYSTPPTATAETSTAGSTPFESCSVSPCESRSISRELILGKCLHEFSTDMTKSVGDHQRKSWAGKIKLIKQFLLSPKLKCSRSYLRSLLGKSGCSDHSSAAATKGVAAGPPQKRKESLNRNENKNLPKGDGLQRDQINRSSIKFSEDHIDNSFSHHHHRRSLSFSGKWRSSNKICSSSPLSSPLSSFSSASASKEQNGFNESKLWTSNRRTDVYTESPIQAAIAYCKQSQHLPEQLKKQPDMCRG